MVIGAFIVVWVVLAFILANESDWHAKDWHLVLGDLLFFVFGYRLAWYHERALTKEGRLTTAAGDLEMLEKIVVLRSHADQLRRCVTGFTSGDITRKEYEATARAPALNFFGDARAGLALFGYAKPKYQKEYVTEIEDALKYADRTIDIDGVRVVAKRLQPKPTRQPREGPRRRLGQTCGCGECQKQKALGPSC